MKASFRRFVAVLLVPLVIVSSVLYPAREAKAVIPVIAPIAMAIYGVGGAVLTADAFAAATTAIVGGIAMAAILSIGGDNPVELRIPLQSDQAKTDAVMPPPSAPGTIPSATTYSPSWFAGGPFASKADLCAVGMSKIAGQCDPTVAASSFTVGASSCSYQYSCGHVSSYTFYAATTCDAGYTVSGTSCNLTSARLAVSDSKVDFQRSGSGFSPIADKDSTKGASSRQMVGNQVQAWGRDSSGNPVVVTTGVNSNGDTTVQVQRGATSAGGQSIVKTDNLVISGSTGAVQSAASTSAAGSVGFDAATGAPVITQGATVTPVESPSIQIPTDYNREVTQQGIRDKTAIAADKLTSIDDQYKAGELSPVSPFDPSGFSPLKPDGGLISSWLATLLSKIGLPAGGQCSNAVIESELLGRPINLSFVNFCNALAPIINWFAWILVVFGVWRGVNRVAGGSESLAEVR